MEDEVAGVSRETISREEVTVSIRHFKPGKSAGPDNIISEMMIHANKSVSDFFGPTL